MRPPNRPALPLDLPRLLMRRATWVGLAVLALALLLGLQRSAEDIRAEEDAAMQLATLMSRLGTLAPLDDAAALVALRAMQQEAPLRHLELQIHDTGGRTLLAPPAPADDPAWLWPLRRLHTWIEPEAPPRRVSWLVPRPGGPAWVISLDASADSERREALTNLAGTLALLLLAIAGLLVVMQLNLRHALAPLAALLGAIAGIERQDPQAVARLPAMPLRELEAIAAALRHLAAALDEAEQRRRLLSQKLLTLQEDERHHLARELHDELGQRLTALRFDAAWLQRRLGAVEGGGNHEVAEVVGGMLKHCADLQQDVRQLLRQLDPFGAEGPAADAPPLPLARLLQLLDALVQGWQGTPAAHPGDAAPQFVWHSGVGGAQGPLRPWHPGQAEAIALPRPLALALYRLSQEALTNAVRHARATRIELRLAFAPPDAAGEPARLHWRVRDDGIGLTNAATALQRGNGLGGMQERVWALGGLWQSGPAQTAPNPENRPGWRLQASLPLTASTAPKP
ncbi:MAG TPA: histidine kinase [Burkholderiaceae bacterium]|nr:histidine kinase [Burkholderiaceae bacterium]HNB45233.1 histidine kinase [Burkholderiaceae bacterium]HNG80906.1 histidine kinase [Burkholderiaceae bacterium]